jgi:putative Holliday junction resolvase
LGITAQGLDTLERQGRREDIEFLRRLALERGVTRILMGDPLHMSGDASRQGDYTREFASELERKTGLAIEFRDERWTSREAERTIRGTGVANRARKPTIDRLSAVILLQSYLDSLRLS